jgi:hypothetical protein
MFPALLAHLQEALHKQQLVFCVHIMSVVYYQDWSGTSFTPILVAANRQHARNIPIVCAAPPEDEQVVLETCRGP